MSKATISTSTLGGMLLKVVAENPTSGIDAISALLLAAGYLAVACKTESVPWDIWEAAFLRDARSAFVAARCVTEAKADERITGQGGLA